MNKEYKYHGEWQQNTGTKPDLPEDTLIDYVYTTRGYTITCLNTGKVDCLDWSIKEENRFNIIFYRIVSDEPITEEQKQEALEEQRRKDGWVVWGMSAQCGSRQYPDRLVKVVHIDGDIASYHDGDYVGLCCAKTGRAFNFQTTAYDLVPYVEEKPTMWNIKDKEHFFSVSAVGDVQFSVWSRSDSNVKRRRLGLCSRTREGAEAIRDRLIAEEEQRRKENE